VDEVEVTPPCTVKGNPDCEGCDISDRLMCRFERRDLLAFAGGFVPFAVVSVSGLVLGGYGVFLLGWLAYAVFFLFIWEAQVLCRHCPYWAGDGRVLRCHANYGVIKLVGYEPTPISRLEGFQFVSGAVLLVGYPFPFLITGGQLTLSAIAVLMGALFGLLLWIRSCSRCVNFSCPLNHVPDQIMDRYLEKNATGG
jgi:hypothetical protein